jgi:hypothetical protein
LPAAGDTTVVNASDANVAAMTIVNRRAMAAIAGSL